MRIALTGATGYVGSVLLSLLLGEGDEVTCLVRNPARAKLPAEVTVVHGDVVTGEGLAEALGAADVAFYLVHSMEGGSSDFAQRDRQGARTFAAAAREAGVKRVIYLGGLESDGSSAHLRSRDEVAELLRDNGPPLVHARAAMVIGEGSASFQMLQGLVRRLPVMICPRWIDTRTQPIAIVDVVAALSALARLEVVPDEVQLGGADVLSYRDMMRRCAEVMGRRAPLIVRVPVLSPGLSSHWVALVTPVDAALARPLVEGLGAEMVVTEQPPAPINEHPIGFDEAVSAALA